MRRAEDGAHDHRQNLIPAGTAAEAGLQPLPRPSFGKFGSGIDPDVPISLQSVPLGYALLTPYSTCAPMLHTAANGAQSTFASKRICS